MEEDTQNENEREREKRKKERRDKRRKYERRKVRRYEENLTVIVISILSVVNTLAVMAVCTCKSHKRQTDKEMDRDRQTDR